MNKFRLVYFIGSLLLVIFVVNQISVAQIIYPIPEPIEKSELSVGLAEVVQIPNSGTNQEKAARLNFLAQAGDSSGRLFVNDMRGKLYVIVNNTATVYMNLKQLICADFTYESDQQGFAYFTFHPEFAQNGIFYTVTSEIKDSGTPDFPVTKTILDRDKNIIESSHHDVIREWKATDPSSNTFKGTSREILRIEQPYRDHNVGQLGFNPNAQPGDDDYGLLYIALADGGSDGFPVSDTDPLDNGQDLGTPLGKILRIDPLGNNSANGQYGIPKDNPFIADNDPKTLGEIWDSKQAKIKELRLFDGEREVSSFLDILGKERSDVRFGVDEAGEIYVTSKKDGKVRKLVSSVLVVISFHLSFIRVGIGNTGVKKV